MLQTNISLAAFEQSDFVRNVAIIEQLSILEQLCDAIKDYYDLKTVKVNSPDCDIRKEYHKERCDIDEKLILSLHDKFTSHKNNLSVKQLLQHDLDLSLFNITSEFDCKLQDAIENYHDADKLKEVARLYHDFQRKISSLFYKLESALFIIIREKADQFSFSVENLLKLLGFTIVKDNGMEVRVSHFVTAKVETAQISNPKRMDKELIRLALDVVDDRRPF